ncbi:MAG: tetratricopeptide repeat protein, partial [Leptolyngbya sp.]|nr:tetratricopeptide repeat protein [Candidatus Melainabacteria bacterium]
MNQSKSVIGSAFCAISAFTIIVGTSFAVSAGETAKPIQKESGDIQIKPRTINDKYIGGNTPSPRSMRSFKLGTARQNQGHYRESLSAFDQAIAIDPKFAAAYVRRGESLLELDDHKAAMANFSKAIQLVPTDWLSYKLRGRIYFEQNDYEKAISDFSASIKYAKNPHHKAEMYKNRGKMYANLGKHDLALADLTKSVTLEPFNAR